MRKGSGPSLQQIFNWSLKLSLVFSKRASKQSPGQPRQQLTCFWFAESTDKHFSSFVQLREVQQKAWKHKNTATAIVITSALFPFSFKCLSFAYSLHIFT